MSATAGPDPRRAITGLDDRTPFVLLPLRLETRFVGAELWIRAFPDDIAITSHEPALTDAELQRGRAYWTAAWGQDAQAAEAAWRTLAAGGLTARALWILRATRPSNAPPAPPSFPPVASKPSSWSTAPRVDVMPDRLVFTLHVGRTVAHEVVGAQIPSPLAVGPDPAVGIQRRPDGTLQLDDAMQWIIDFDRAVAAGMAVKIPLGTGPQAFDRLVAVGVRLGAPADGAAQLARLLEGHRYVDGLELVAQGTPTNHTDAAAAGGAGETAAQAVARELGPALFAASADPLARSDGARLAAALGIPDAALDHVRATDRRDVAEAVAMNRALWPATLGYFAEQMMAPAVDDALREEARKLVTGFVRGRGALPAVMAGRQPYGVLPTTAFSRWQAAADESPLLARIDAALHTLAATWAGLAASVAQVGAGGDPDGALIDVLGLQASSVAFHQRRAVGPEYLWNLAAFQGDDPAPRRREHIAAAGALLHGLGLAFAAGQPRALDLELFRAHAPLSLPAIDDKPLSEDRGLDPNYIEWLRGALDAIKAEKFGAPVPRTLLYVLLRRAILLGAWDASMRLLVAHGLASAADRKELELVNVRAAGEPTRWDHLDARITGVTGAAAVGDFARTPQSGDAGAAYREQLAALAVLSPLPTARLERLLAEHIDVCSYRLDAWQLGRAAQRLEAMRAARRDGVYLGAYGWLESVQRQPPAAPAGYVHAPSLAHATAAAILRSGYETHADPAQRQRMAVDLRSERVRRALRYLQGLREGQDLAALLGFRFERGLRDGNPTLALEQFVLALRQAFPLVAGRAITPDAPGGSGGSGAADPPIDAVEARNVVDGTRLLAARATGYPYGATGLPAASSPAGRAILAEVDRLADDMDAIADLMLAESVYQAAQGRQERASAFTTGLAAGTPPPDPEIAATPRSGIAVTHRICLLLPASDASTSRWTGSTPRSRFEPVLDRWLGRALGDPATIRVRVAAAGAVREVRCDELAIHPIDLVHECSGSAQELPAALVRRIQRAVRTRDRLAPDAAVELRWAERDPGWGPSVRTLFEVMPLLASLASLIQGRSLDARDLDPDGGDPRQDLAELTARVTAAVGDLASALASGQAARADEWLAGSALAQRADAALADLTALHASAAAALPAASGKLDALTAIAKLLFGAPFTPLPRFAPGNGAELAHALGAPALLAGGPPLAIQEWLQGVGRVRPRAAAYDSALLLADMLGGQIEAPTLAQLPFDPAGRWLGLELAAGSPRDGRALSLVLHTAGGYDPQAPQIGLLIDELVEVIPAAAEVTGIAFQHQRPTSEPPQSLLVVVPPALRGTWQWADLAGAVSETLDLARLRAVEPSAVARTGYAQFLPAIVGPVTDQPVTITLDLGRLV